MDLDNSQVIQLYEKMLLIRRFEEQSGRLYMQGKINGFLHLYIGEEAIAVGAISSLRDDDYIITHYRDHGHALARGVHPNLIMAELMGKVTGTSGGKGGSMHIFDVSKGFMGGHAIVGGQMPLAAGLALAIKYRGEDRAVLCVFGDGAVNEGSFHETMNLASLWKLPIIFLLENNLYGMGTHIERTRAGGKDIYLAADAYKIPAAQIDGMDVVAVRDSIAEALERVRAGEGPVFLEAMTYRFVGHSLQDPQEYRESDEVDQWRIRDPIDTFREAALVDGLLDDGQITRIGERVDAAIAEAIAFAEQSDEPGPEALFENVQG
ncbi:MAG: pyruvate dehydrogenase (acetyl-transferring) E1 component subunit alpha [SAR202 cluster bacterium]|nr:pyruvate dehydrogenase (acetyl-transferring) E1 component subunit alpha [SAR202 cluster bacterium]